MAETKLDGPAASDDDPASTTAAASTDDQAAAAATDDQADGTPSTTKRIPWRSPLIAALVVGALAVAVNWPLQYLETSVLGGADLFLDFKFSQPELPVMAGWPFRYSIHYAESGNSPEVSVFSTSALLRNIGLTLVLMALVCVYLFRRGQKTPATDAKKLRITIGDLLVLTVLVAAPFGMWQWLGRTSEQSQTFASRLSNGDAMVRSSVWMPAVLRSYLPQKLVTRLRRIRSVRIENPSEEILRQAAGIATLTSLRIGGGDYDLADLQPLGRAVHLHDLRIAGRDLDAATIRMIASVKRLRGLNVMRTNVTSDAVKVFGELPNLRWLNLMHTDVRLADLGMPEWSDTIEILVLPHPDSGKTDQLVIEGWPNLVDLTISEYDTQVNSKTMKVRLANLPLLRLIELDQFQKFDLEVSELPSLARIDGVLANWDARLPRGGVVPGAIWFERFAGSGLPYLSDLKFFCVDLKSFSLQGPTKIASLGAGVYYRSLNQSRIANPYERKLKPSAATALIEGLGGSTGPAEVDLDAVPLGGVDLSPLAENEQLSSLLLAASGSNIDQWRQLSKMKWLRHLRLTSNPIDEKGVQWALKTFPNLETLEYGFDPALTTQTTGRMTMSYSSGPEELLYVGHKNLKTVVRPSSRFIYQHSVKIVDMPKLEIPVEVDWPQSVLIRNSPRLTGISVSGPLPPDTELGQQSNLDFFAVGGPGVNDSVANSILGSDRMSVLTLAYPAVSGDVIAKLPVGNLSGLHLPGSLADDEVVQAWPKLTTLLHLNLADTQISAASLPKLLAPTSLETLTLDRCPITADQLGILAERFSLRELSVAGIGLPPKALAELLQEASFTVLDLSDLEIPNELMDAIANNGSSLRHLSLRNAKFDSKRLLAAVKRHRQLVVDLTGSNVDTELNIKLLSVHRLKTKAEWKEQIEMEELIRQPSAYQVGSPIMTYEYKPPSLIVVEDFAAGGRYSAESLGEDASAETINTTSNGVSPDAPPVGVRTGQWLGGMFGKVFGGETTESSADENEAAAADVDGKAIIEGEEE